MGKVNGIVASSLSCIVLNINALHFLVGCCDRKTCACRRFFYKKLDYKKRVINRPVKKIKKL